MPDSCYPKWAVQVGALTMLNPARRIKGLWWDEGIGLVGGCSPVSPGCANCWRAKEAHMRKSHPNSKIRARYEGLTDEWGRWTGEIRVMRGDLNKPLNRQKPTVYAVWNDLLHEDVPNWFIDAVLLVACQCPQHTFLVLTKRPERALWYAKEARKRSLRSFEQAPNLWLGFTAENQQWFDRRWAFAKRIPTAKIFPSYEPALGPLVLPPDFLDRGNDAWVICGGETGSRARPSHPDWFRRVRDDCQAAGVPFWFKGWGEWTPRHNLVCSDHFGMFDEEGNWQLGMKPWTAANDFKEEGFVMAKVGKKAAGRVLDGRTWEEMPCPG